MPIIDLHCDTIGCLYNKNDADLSQNNLQIDVDKLIKGQYMLQCFAMFVDSKKAEPFKTCIEMIDLFYEQIAKNKDLKVCYTFNDIIKNANDQKISALLTIEEGEVIEGNLSYLKTLHRLGVRMICLSWNYKNQLGYPNINLNQKNIDHFTPNVEDGLTKFGIEVVKMMNDLNMIIDVSHLSDRGFWDVINTSTKPIVASHSNCRSVCNHVRNLTDEMIIALNKNGGIMGMNYCNEFLDNNPQIGRRTIECLIKHIKHIKKLVGVDVIALGSDFDGINSNIELKDASLLTQLVDALYANGFTKEEIDKITYKNALRVFQKVLI